jgi:alanine racemase
MALERNIAGRPLWADVSRGALAGNLRAIRNYLECNAPICSGNNGFRPNSYKRVRILAVVKGNGYGHGAVSAARVFAAEGVNWFGVTCSAEGAELRESGIRKPILVLTGFWDGEEQQLIDFNLTPAVTHCSQLIRLEKAARAAPRLRRPFGFHLKIDTGMNRLGISIDSIDCVARTLSNCPHLRLAGTFTHFAASEDFTSSQTEEQECVFRLAITQLRKHRLSPGLVHMANSAAAIFRPGTRMDMIRAGTVLYGYHQRYNPCSMKADAERSLQLRPALSLRTQIIGLKDVPAGSGVGYNARFRATRPTRVAVIAAGYADCLPYNLSEFGGLVSLKGKLVPVVGAVSMDLATLDVSKVEDVRLGDVVTIYGSRASTSAKYCHGPSDACLDASEIAARLGMKTSAVLSMISKRVPRIYVA